MFSDKRNILQLLALLQSHHISNVVLCPGSRNAPIVHSFGSSEFFHCSSLTDERSAGFFAIGQAISRNEPVVVCCTSGSALANLYPSVAEAYYQQIPLIIVSADRPQAWIGQMDGQTMPQPNIFGTMVKKAVNVPEIHTDEEEWYCNRLINEVLLEVNHHGCGPVHINIPISEPLFQFTTKELPQVRTIQRCTVEELMQYTFDGRKVMLIAGQENSNDKDYLQDLGALTPFACLAEHLFNSIFTEPQHSGTPFIRNFDTALYSMNTEEKAAMAPDVVITFAGHIVSKRLKTYLRTYKPKIHIHVSTDGSVADLFQSLSIVAEGRWKDMFKQFSLKHCFPEASTDFARRWTDYCNKITEPTFPYSEMSAIGTLIRHLPHHSVLHLANSSSVRYAQLYTLPPDIEVCCNRGMNGIEGSLSSAVGYASDNRSKENFLVIGDLSFFYDMNALWYQQLPTHMHILLLNNGGGEIFQSLPGLNMNDRSHAMITATHKTSAAGWAQERGLRYLRTENEIQLNDCIDEFVRHGEQSVIMEVMTDASHDVALLKEYYHQLKHK